MERFQILPHLTASQHMMWSFGHPPLPPSFRLYLKHQRDMNKKIGTQSFSSWCFLSIRDLELSSKWTPKPWPRCRDSMSGIKYKHERKERRDMPGKLPPGDTLAGGQGLSHENLRNKDCSPRRNTMWQVSAVFQNRVFMKLKSLCPQSERSEKHDRARWQKEVREALLVPRIGLEFIQSTVISTEGRIFNQGNDII